MHGLPVTFVLDRAGITGPDGPSHYGIWDMAAFGVVPGLRIAAPRDSATLRAELREAVGVSDGPTIVRFPTGTAPADLPAVGRVGPVASELVELARGYRLVVSVEDGIRTGGVGEAIGQALRDAGSPVPMIPLGVPAGWHPHGSRGEILSDLGLTAQDVARRVVETVSGLDPVDAPLAESAGAEDGAPVRN